MEKKEPWEILFERHKSDELSELLIHLIRVLVKRGECTAEDCHDVPVSNTNIRGAAMRSLARLGIAKKAMPSTGTTKQSHGHNLYIWRLSDYSLACQILKRFAAVVLGNKSPDSNGQLILF